MELDNTIVIVADMEELKIYEVKKHERDFDNEQKIVYSLEIFNDANFIEGAKQLHELKSDANGRINHGSTEEDTVKEEIERRTLSEVTQSIDMLVKETHPKSLFLAFPKKHHSQLAEKLSQQTKAILKKNLALDLVKTEKDKLLEYFL